MPAIAKASDITAGAIYKHFKSKGELLLEVVKRSFESTPLFMQNSAAATTTALPRLASAYTEPELKLVRQLSIEVHSAASRDSDVRRLLAISDEAAMQYISDAIALAQREGKLDPKLKPEFAARLYCVFVMGLLHMDTLAARSNRGQILARFRTRARCEADWSWLSGNHSTPAADTFYLAFLPLPVSFTDCGSRSALSMIIRVASWVAAFVRDQRNLGLARLSGRLRSGHRRRSDFPARTDCRSHQGLHC